MLCSTYGYESDTAVPVSEPSKNQICSRCSEYALVSSLSPCLHFFCDPCLSQLSQNSKCKSSDYIICPSCKKRASFPKDKLILISQGVPKENTIFKTVGDFSAYSSIDESNSLCASCDEGNKTIARCKDCNEVLCENCVRAHQRVRLTKDHIIDMFSNDTGDFQLQPNYKYSHFCDLHPTKILKVYCEDCQEALCNECIIDIVHFGHSMRCIQEAVTDCKQATLTLLKEYNNDKRSLEESIQLNQRISDDVELKIQNIATEIRTTIRKHICALEERENKLLCQLEKIRQIKTKAILLQTKDLKLVLKDISQVIDVVQHKMDTDIDLLKAKKKCIAEMNEIRQRRSNMQLYEDNNIIFLESDNALLSAISTLGSLSTSGFGPNSVAGGEGLHQAICHHQSTFLVQIKDYLGEIQTVGGEELYVSIQSPDGINYQADVVDRQNGTYAICFIPEVVGQHIISVLLRGMHIQHSPFHVDVHMGRNYCQVSKMLLSFGTEGDGDGELCRPWGVCTDKSGNIIVADRSNNRVQIFNPNGTFKLKFGTLGSRPGQFDKPAGITTDQLDRIIVADKDNHRIQIFDAEGNFLLKFGERGRQNGQFCFPWDVASNSNNEILVSDTKNYRLQLFSADGFFIENYRINGNPGKEFSCPRGVSFTAENHIIVTDFNNSSLFKINSNFRLVTSLSQETPNNMFIKPQGVCVDQQGFIILADFYGHCIKIYRPNGHFLCKIGSYGTGPGYMDRPSGVCVSPEGSIIVSDFGNNRIQVF